MKNRILIVDGDSNTQNLLKTRLEREGYAVTTCTQKEEAERELNAHPDFGVCIVEVGGTSKGGMDLLMSAKRKFAHVRMVALVPSGDHGLTLRAFREGAFDCFQKPVSADEVTQSINRATRDLQVVFENRELVTRLEARVQRVEGKVEDQFWFVSNAKAMNKINEWLTILRRDSMRGNSDEPTVLIQGERGSGKEGIARMIHAGSRRAKGPWIAVNCAHFSEQVLEGELFGHEKGAFTGAMFQKRGLFELSKGGTLFLDEVAEMEPKLQAKVLKVLREKKFQRLGGTEELELDTRIIAATYRNLQRQVKEGLFREDLYQQISRMVIELPPLRDRIEDVVPLAKQFAERAFRSRGKSFMGFGTDAENAMKGYTWPGNVRELLNVVERAALLSSGEGAVLASVLSLPNQNGTASASSGSGGSGASVSGGSRLEAVTSPYHPPHSSGMEGYMSLKKKWCDSFEREYLISALSRHGGNVSAAAREAKIDRSNFLRLLRRHQLRAQEYRKAA